MRRRALTAGEFALAQSVFADRIRLETVRILSAPWPLTRAFVPGCWFGRDWIVWPAKQVPDDAAKASTGVQAMLIHELVHVWQAQNGLNLLLCKLRAGDGPAAYAYPLDDRCDWSGLNIEQQAMVVEHRFVLSRGGRAPANRAFYDRVCPLARFDPLRE